MYLFLDDNEGEETKSPLADFKIALSPTRDIIVFGKASWMLIYVCQWNSKEKVLPKEKYVIHKYGHLQCKQQYVLFYFIFLKMYTE